MSPKKAIYLKRAQENILTCSLPKCCVKHIFLVQEVLHLAEKDLFIFPTSHLHPILPDLSSTFPRTISTEVFISSGRTDGKYASTSKLWSSKLQVAADDLWTLSTLSQSLVFLCTPAQVPAAPTPCPKPLWPAESALPWKRIVSKYQWLNGSSKHPSPMSSHKEHGNAVQFNYP